MVMIRYRGFTLAELLIALAILGVIATFTIPKVLQSQQDGKYKAIAKESAGMVSTAYQQALAAGTVTSSTKIGDLKPFFNYVAVDTSSNIDDWQTATTVSCATSSCLRLHNGAMMHFSGSTYFGGTATTNALWFAVDPDGKVTDGTTNGPGKSVYFLLYYNGMLRTSGTGLTGSTYSAGAYAISPSYDPPWFSWD